MDSRLDRVLVALSDDPLLTIVEADADHLGKLHNTTCSNRKNVIRYGGRRGGVDGFAHCPVCYRSTWFRFPYDEFTRVSGILME